MLRLEDVRKDLGNFRLEVNLEVERDEYFIVLGPSGSWKTLLLEVIAGIVEPDVGRVYIDDLDVTLLPPERRNVGYVPQDYALFPHLNVYENVAYGLRARRTMMR